MIINDKHTPIRQEFLEHVKGLFYTDQNVLPSATGDKFKDVPRGFHHGDDRTVKRMRRKRQNWATSFFPHWLNLLNASGGEILPSHLMLGKSVS